MAQWLIQLNTCPKAAAYSLPRFPLDCRSCLCCQVHDYMSVSCNGHKSALQISSVFAAVCQILHLTA